MQFDGVLRQRRMIRSYDEARSVPADALDAILDSGAARPLRRVHPGVSLLVLITATERETFWRIATDDDSRWLRGMRTAPVLILSGPARRPTSIATPRLTKAGPIAIRLDGPRHIGSSTPEWHAWPHCCRAVDQDLGACFFGIPADRIRPYVKRSACRRAS